jgi:hypothetical protein
MMLWHDEKEKKFKVGDIVTTIGGKFGIHTYGEVVEKKLVKGVVGKKMMYLCKFDKHSDAYPEPAILWLYAYEMEKSNA